MHRAIGTFDLTPLTLFSISLLFFVPREGKNILLQPFVQEDIFGKVLKLVVSQVLFLPTEEAGEFGQPLLDVVFEARGAS